MGQRGRGKIGASYADDPRVEERTHTSQKTGALEVKVGGANGVPTHSLGVHGRLVWLSRVWVETIDLCLSAVLLTKPRGRLIDYACSTPGQPGLHCTTLPPAHELDAVLRTILQRRAQGEVKIKRRTSPPKGGSGRAGINTPPSPTSSQHQSALQVASIYIQTKQAHRISSEQYVFRFSLPHNRRHGATEGEGAKDHFVSSHPPLSSKDSGLTGSEDAAVPVAAAVLIPRLPM